MLTIGTLTYDCGRSRESRVSRAPLRRRASGAGFRWLLASSWVSSLGDGLALSAGPLLVASQSHKAIWVASAMLLQRLPWLVLGLFAGALADRVDRRAHGGALRRVCGRWCSCC